MALLGAALGIAAAGRQRLAAAGLTLFAASDLLIFRQLGMAAPEAWSAWAIWYLYFAGVLMVALRPQPGLDRGHGFA
jgi:hypothetical protein